MHKFIAKAYQNHNLSKDELVFLLKDENLSEQIYQAADETRKKYVGDDVHLRGLIEFSNICRNNCLYCGLRAKNQNIKRYRMSIDEIETLAKHAKKMGLQTIVLQSGEDMWFDTAKMVEIIRKIKALNMALTLSIGEKSFAEYKAYKEAGADRFLIRFETTDKQLYLDNDPNMDWDRRIKCLENLHELGFEVGSGCLVGLPNQTTESLADDILFLKKIDCHMAGIGPFIPHPDTPLKNAQGGDFETARKVMALTRLLLPDINIPATTAMETLSPNGQILALQSGANVIMPNVTLKDYRKFYELYPGKSSTNATPDESLDSVIKKIESIGRKVATDVGTSKKWLKENND